MLVDVDPKASGLTNTTTDVCRTIALHVLTSAGFGVRNGYRAGVTDVQDGYSLTYRDALGTVLENMVLAVFLPL